MLGRELDALYPQRAVKSGPVALSVKQLTGAIVRDVSFDLHEGEIVGLTGLLGMGHDETPYLLFGAKPAAGGTIAISGRPYRELTPLQAMRAGLAFLPADRQRQSGIPKATLTENIAAAAPSQRFGGINHAQERSAVQRLLQQFDVRPADPDRLLATLSGGNQQKALLGKWLQNRPNILILHEPTQGVDVGSRKQILQIIAEAAAAGTAVLVASAEYEELAHLCHRVLIFRRGAVVSELAGDALTETRIAEQCFLA